MTNRFRISLQAALVLSFLSTPGSAWAKEYAELRTGVKFLPGDSLFCLSDRTVRAELTKGKLLRTFRTTAKDKSIWTAQGGEAKVDVWGEWIYVKEDIYLALDKNGKLAMVETGHTESYSPGSEQPQENAVWIPAGYNPKPNAVLTLDKDGSLVIKVSGKEVWRSGN
jgi:hypothetical protein